MTESELVAVRCQMEEVVKNKTQLDTQISQLEQTLTEQRDQHLAEVNKFKAKVRLIF